MAVCSKCNRVIKAGAKACDMCGAPLPIGTAKKKDLLKPKMSLDEVLQKTNTDIVRAKTPVKRLLFYAVLLVLAAGAVYVGKSALVLFDGSGKEYREKIHYDPSSGLLWQKQQGAPMFHEYAEQYCRELRIGDLKGWRLPTVAELRTLIRGCSATIQKGPCMVRDTCLGGQCLNDDCDCAAYNGPGEEGLYWQTGVWLDPEWKSKSGFFWSSSRPADVESGKQAWGVSFATGGIAVHDPSTAGYARCVSGPVPASDRLKQYFMFMK